MDAKVAPSAPTGVSATAGDGQVTISWSAVSRATSYNLYFGTTTGVTKTTGTKVAGVTSPSAHTGRTNGTTYFYVVTAANAAGESAESTQVGATPQVPAPGAPTGPSATAGNGQVRISWSAVTGATSYNLYFSTSTGVTKTNSTKITGVTSPYTHTGRTNGTAYFYVVTAQNAGGESAESAQVSATPVGAPGDFDLTFGSQGVLTDNATTNAGGTGSDQGKAVGIDSTGRVVVAGWATRGGGFTDRDIVVWRFTSTGSADSAFGTSGVFKHNNAAGGNGDDVAEEFAFENTAGGILVTGTSRATIQSDAMVLMRVRGATTNNLDGTLDTTFGSSGIASYSPSVAADRFSGRGVVVDSSNRILITGSFRSGSISTDAMAIWRFSQTGSLDTAATDTGFGPFTGTSQGYLTSDNAAGGSGDDAGEAIVLDSQSRIVAAGYSQGAATRVGAVWRRQASGDEGADLTFNVTGQIFNTTTTWAAVTRDSSDRIYVAGAEGLSAPRDLIVQRITSTGAVDSGNFGTAGTFDFARTGDDYAQAIALDSSGRVLVAGTMQGSTGNADMVVLRLNTAGQLDTSFGGGSGFITIDRGGNEVAEDIAIDSSGRIFVVGHTTNTTTQISDMVVAKLLP
jgi:uncharacterized delta-60 repeat protein